MTHISKHSLQPKHLEQLFAELSDVIAKADATTSPLLLDELLGKEEKIMLAKRLAAIAMCIEGNSSYRISQLLYMSPSTTERIVLNYDIGCYEHIANLLQSDKVAYKKFWERLDIILRAGMPPHGRGRWKSVLDRR